MFNTLTSFCFSMIAMRVNAILAIAVAATGSALFCSDIIITSFMILPAQEPHLCDKTTMNLTRIPMFATMNTVIAITMS